MGLTTYRDLIDSTLKCVTNATDEENVSYAREAVQQGYDVVTNAHDWQYYYDRLRINLVAPQTTGTVTGDVTGGAFERMLTLSGATWPSWALYGTIQIDSVAYEVATVESTTILTLTRASAPVADIAAGTSYTIYRDTYPLPTDFARVGALQKVGNDLNMSGVSATEWLALARSRQGVGSPTFWCVTGDRNYFGALAIRFWPPPDGVDEIDAIYKCRPRDMAIELYNTGTVTCAASTVVTGTGTTWTAAMIGSCIRFSDSTTAEPTGPSGSRRYYRERTIVGVLSTTSITIDVALDVTVTGVKYTISDPADVESGAMLTYLKEECRMQIRLLKNMETPTHILRSYESLKLQAKAADRRSMERKKMGGDGPHYRRLADMPYDQSV